MSTTHRPGTLASIRHSPASMSIGVARLAIRNGNDTGWVCSFGSGHNHFDMDGDFQVVEILGNAFDLLVSTRGNEALVPDDMVTVSRVLAAASNLVSEDGDNPEYDRAISELVCDLLGFHMDTKDRVLTILQALR